MKMISLSISMNLQFERIPEQILSKYIRRNNLMLVIFISSFLISIAYFLHGLLNNNQFSMNTSLFFGSLLAQLFGFLITTRLHLQFLSGNIPQRRPDEYKEGAFDYGS